MPVVVEGTGLTVCAVAVARAEDGERSWYALLVMSAVLVLSVVVNVAHAVQATHLGMVLAGAAVVRAGRWTGWHRFTPLACGLFIPLVLLPSFALPGLAMHYALGTWGGCWLLLGLALRAEATGPS